MSLKQDTDTLDRPLSNNSHVKTQTACHRSLIGKAVFIKGDFAAKEDVLINGHLEGMIAIKEHWLEIGEGARIEANAFAKVIVINGELKGDVYASEQVIISKTGRIFGNIYSASVSMEDGALIKGSIDMDKHDISHSNLDIQHDDNHSKAASFSMLFKKVQEMAHLHSNQELEENEAESAIVANNVNVSSPAISAPVWDKSAMQAHHNMNQSVIGETVLIKGEIVSEEDVIIKGKTDGIIYFKNNNLEVSSTAEIVGNIFVKSVSSSGESRGDIYASEFVTIRKSGHIYGKILSPRISIESGAVFKGTIEMEPQNIEKIFSNLVVSSKEKDHHAAKSDSKVKKAENSDDKSSASKKIDALVGTFEKI